MLKKVRIRKIILLFIGYLLIVIGLSLISIKIFINLKNKKELSIEIENNNLGNNVYNNLIIESINEKQSINYIAYLKIPKINLIKGLVDKSSGLNNVDKNIQILKESDMPDKENGNLVLAAHSGNSNVSYFKDLDKLEINDRIHIEYNSKQYEYKVVNYYIVEKIGYVDIIRNKDKSTLTLITCVENANKQLVVICELNKITNL